MKLASVTFFDPISEIGGASVPARAFLEWATLFGHRCDLLYNPSPITLNQYDGVFFNTPPKLNQDFKITEVFVPFVFMLHAESDTKKYPLYVEFSKHPCCVALLHIDHDGDYYSAVHKKRLAWHPCCSPRNLIYPTQPRETKDDTILYASRIVPSKTPHLVKQYKIMSNAPVRIMGRVDDVEYAQQYGLDNTPFRCADYYMCSMFWDVCMPDVYSDIKRMDLAAFEALSEGLMPIVNPNVIPSELRNLFIEFDPLTAQMWKLEAAIIQYKHNKEKMWSHAISRLNTSYASFRSVELVMANVFDLLRSN